MLFNPSAIQLDRVPPYRGILLTPCGYHQKVMLTVLRQAARGSILKIANFMWLYGVAFRRVQVWNMQLVLSTADMVEGLSLESRAVSEHRQT